MNVNESRFAVTNMELILDWEFNLVTTNDITM